VKTGYYVTESHTRLREGDMVTLEIKLEQLR
jgi:hypothetical protein